MASAPPGQKRRLRVLLRDGLRPPLFLARKEATDIFCTEVVAGLIEKEDIGEAGLRKRAALEVHEETGYHVSPADCFPLGARTFPTPGALPEAFHFMAVEIPDPNQRDTPPGDGSPMEEGATCHWLDLDQAIASLKEARASFDFPRAR